MGAIYRGREEETTRYHYQRREPEATGNSRLYEAGIF